MFKIKTIVVATFILISQQLYAAQSVEEIIKGRKAMFSENYQNAKKISILLKSKKIEEAKPLMKKISDNYKKLLDYFPENTKEGFKTEALLIIWEEKDNFNNLEIVTPDGITAFYLRNPESLQVPSKPYDTSADADTLLNRAINSLEPNKKLLLILGGNWCPDCRIFSGTIEIPKIKEYVIFTSNDILNKNYIFKSSISSKLAKDKITIYKRNTRNWNVVYNM